MDNNHMVKKLAGKLQRDTATPEDLAMAKATVKNNFIVGLMKEMKESVRRFNVVMNISEESIGESRWGRCNEQFFGASGGKTTNSNKHPKVSVLRCLD